MDPLSDIVALLRPSTAVSKPITGRGEWGVRYAAQPMPGFTIIVAGQCWLALDGQEPLRLGQGDFVLLPSTPAFRLFSAPGVACVQREPTSAAVRHGEQEGEPDFVSLGGTFRIDQANAPLLLSLLPTMVHVRPSDAEAGRLVRIIDLILEESIAELPGKEMLLQRLLEVMLVECLRWRRVGEGALAAGLLTGLRDPALARALNAMHADVRAGWTIAGLARIAGMSRSAFAARFGDKLGCGPIEYLSRWRMALAQDSLMRGVKSLDRIADDIGYESASAFSTAFRRRMGCSPGRFGRLHRGVHTP